MTGDGTTEAARLDLDGIEARATAATPGTWSQGDVDKGDNAAMVYCDDATGQRVADCTGRYLCFSTEQMRANAAHIAGLDPQIVLALVARLRAAENALRDHESGQGSSGKDLSTMEKAALNALSGGTWMWSGEVGAALGESGSRAIEAYRPALEKLCMRGLVVRETRKMPNTRRVYYRQGLKSA